MYNLYLVGIVSVAILICFVWGFHLDCFVLHSITPFHSLECVVFALLSTFTKLVHDIRKTASLLVCLLIYIVLQSTDTIPDSQIRLFCK